MPLAVHDIYHDDVIVEFPKSGERISGKHNEYELWKHYPSKPGFKILKVCGEGSLWVTELIITYDDGRPVNGGSHHGVQDDKVAKNKEKAIHKDFE